MTRFAILFLLATSCFNPKFQNGVPCTADRVCPEGQVCAADDRCYDPDKVPEFSDAGIDAADDVLRVVEIAGGSNHTCALLSDGRLRCFGKNLGGQLGLANTVSFGDNEPANSAPFVQLPRSRSVGLGLVVSCAIFESAEVLCWGGQGQGELGQGDPSFTQIGDDEEPASIPPIDVGGDAAEVCSGNGGHFTCVRLVDGQVRCFGIGFDPGSPLGLPGVSKIGYDDRPAQFPSIDLGNSPIVDIDCGSVHACALNSDGQVICWGGGSQGGALGYPGMPGVGFNEDPIDAGFVDVGATVEQIALGSSHSCALLSSGSIRCWGAAANLGISASEDIGDDEPPSSAGLVDVGGAAAEIKASGNTTCARLKDGSVRCWGFPNGHTAAPVGDNEPPSSFAPLPFPAPAVSLGLGGQHACAILENHEVYCWGEGADGRLGYGDELDVGIGTSVTIKGPVPIL